MRHVGQHDNLTEPVFLILLSLKEAPRHGYGLLKNIEAMSGGRVRLSTGTLYGALRRLLDDAWIEPFETDDTSRDKRAYRITALGGHALNADFERLQDLTRIAGPRLRTLEAQS